MNLILRYMRADDIREVSRIDRLCFEPPWSRDSYAFEIKESKISHMVVLEERAHPIPALPPQDDGWMRRLSGWMRQDSPAIAKSSLIVGYGGLWKIEGEAHVSTIATHPEQRGRGYGEILLAGMFRKALRLKAEYLVLEVRVSNAVAQNLYRKYGFCRQGRKRNYYRSDREDAYDMRVSLDSSVRQHFSQLYLELQQSRGFHDAYSVARHPRW